MIEVREYRTAEGHSPFGDWLRGIRDSRARARILKRLDRVRLDLMGDCRSVGGGVLELRVDYGRGYRVYFGRHGTGLVLLLIGGDKRTQQRDIEHAQNYWQNWKQREGR